MIDARSAVDSAKNYFQGMQDLLESHSGVRLEEIELSSDKQFWLITLGFDRNSTPDLFGNSRVEHFYKVFWVNVENGQVEAMKIRNV